MSNSKAMLEKRLHYRHTIWRLMPIPRRIVSLAAFISLAYLLSVAASCLTQAQTVSTAPYLDANGWTVFTRSAATRVIYVSNSTGKDSNNGLSPSAPVKTIAKGLSGLRNGYPDWLLLKKGDVWTESSQIKTSGRSNTEPMLISSYGTGARPLIKTSSALGAGFISFGAGGGGAGGNNVAFVGLELYASDRDPASPDFNPATVGKSVSGFVFLNPIKWMLIEDCKISFFSENIGLTASLVFATSGFGTNITLRRNVIVDAYTINTNGGNGLAIGGINNLVIEENLFDHNGYEATLTDPEQYKFNHNIYVSAYLTEYDKSTISNPIVMRGNIIANDASGSQLRSGGTITNNLWLRNPYPFGLPLPTAFASVVSENVVLEAASNAGQPFNWGIMSGTGTNYDAGTVAISNNIVAHTHTRSTNSVGIELGGTASSGSITNNIVFDWVEPLLTYPAGATVSGNNLDAAGANNNPGGTAPSEPFPDPTRSVGSYYDTIVGGSGHTTSDFLTAARAQSKGNWNPQLMAAAVNNYIQAGFGVISNTNSSRPQPTR